MLIRVRIDGFRSCRNVVLSDLGQVTALIGRNAAGKSSVLNAVVALANLACSSGPDSRGWEAIPIAHEGFEEEVGPFSAAAEVSLDGRTYLYTVKVLRVVKDMGPEFEEAITFDESLSIDKYPNPSVIVFRRTEGAIELPSIGSRIAVGSGVASLAALASLLPTEDPILAQTEPLRRFFAGVRYYPLDEPATGRRMPWIDGKTYRTWAAEFNTTGVLSGHVTLQLLHLYLTRRDRFDELVGNLGRKGLGLIENVEFIVHRPVGKEAPEGEFYAAFFHQWPRRLGKRPFGYSDLSQGTRRMVRLLTALAYGEWPVMLLEHPEDGVHRGLVRKLAGMLTAGSFDGQVILSTHSDALMDELGAENIRLVTIEDGVTSVRKLTEAELAGVAQYLTSGVEGTLSEFLHSMEE